MNEMNEWSLMKNGDNWIGGWNGGRWVGVF